MQKWQAPALHACQEPSNPCQRVAYSAVRCWAFARMDVSLRLNAARDRSRNSDNGGDFMTPAADLNPSPAEAAFRAMRRAPEPSDMQLTPEGQALMSSL